MSPEEGAHDEESVHHLVFVLGGDLGHVLMGVSVAAPINLRELSAHER